MALIFCDGAERCWIVNHPSAIDLHVDLLNKSVPRARPDFAGAEGFEALAVRFGSFHDFSSWNLIDSFSLQPHLSDF